MRHGIKAWEITGWVSEDGDVLCHDCAPASADDDGWSPVFADGDDCENLACDECGETLIETF